MPRGVSVFAIPLTLQATSVTLGLGLGTWDVRAPRDARRVSTARVSIAFRSAPPCTVQRTVDSRAPRRLTPGARGTHRTRDFSFVFRLRRLAARIGLLGRHDGGGQSEQFDQFHDDGSLGFDNELETHSIWRCAGSACAPSTTSASDKGGFGPEFDLTEPRNALSTTAYATHRRYRSGRHRPSGARTPQR